MLRLQEKPIEESEEPTSANWDRPIWRQIPDFPNYWLSDEGKVFNMKTKKMVYIWINPRGYRYVRMYRKAYYHESRGYSRSMKILIEQLFGKEL